MDTKSKRTYSALACLLLFCAMILGEPPIILYRRKKAPKTVIEI